MPVKYRGEAGSSMLHDRTDRHFLDIVPGYWMWRQDPTIDAMLHNNEVFPIVSMLFVGAVGFAATWKYLGYITRPDTRPLFTVNKKTWIGTKVPRKRYRDYATRFLKPPPD